MTTKRMTTQPTPGPWSVVESESDDARDYRVEPAPHGATWGDVIAQREANARLIEAAPELLRALVDVSHLHNSGPLCWCPTATFGYDNTVHESYCEQASAAVRAAKGETQ